MLFAFTCAVTLLTSSLNVFYRDVSPVVTIALQLWLYLTPVAYSLSAVPPRYRLFFALNPLTAIIEGTRSAFVFNRPPDWSLIGEARGHRDRRAARRILRDLQVARPLFRGCDLNVPTRRHPAAERLEALSRGPIAHVRGSDRVEGATAVSASARTNRSTA